jgi:hypothetical protein
MAEFLPASHTAPARPASAHTGQLTRSQAGQPCVSVSATTSSCCGLSGAPVRRRTTCSAAGCWSGRVRGAAELERLFTVVKATQTERQSRVLAASAAQLDPAWEVSVGLRTPSPTCPRTRPLRPGRSASQGCRMRSQWRLRVHHRLGVVIVAVAALIVPTGIAIANSYHHAVMNCSGQPRRRRHRVRRVRAQASLRRSCRTWRWPSRSSSASLGCTARGARSSKRAPRTSRGRRGHAPPVVLTNLGWALLFEDILGPNREHHLPAREPLLACSGRRVRGSSLVSRSHSRSLRTGWSRPVSLTELFGRLSDARATVSGYRCIPR